MLQQTQDALAAAARLDAGTAVSALAAVVGGIGAGALPGDVAIVLTPDASRALDNAILLAATADTAQLAAVHAPDAPSPAGSGTTDPVATGIQSPAPTGTDPVASDPGTTQDPVTTTNPAPANTAPVIGGTPAAAVQVGASYGFQPLASDADGDSLIFSITGKPAWATFSTGTGRLGGTPGGADAGTCDNILIAVSDGTDSATLPAFSIRVDPATSQTGHFDLQWTAPVARADGTPLALSEIGGYRIHYGTASGSYPDSVDVSDGSATSATVSNLPLGTYRVVMTNYDSQGLESAPSSEVVKDAR